MSAASNAAFPALRVEHSDAIQSNTQQEINRSRIEAFLDD
jgi:hypothetical protein